MSFRDAARERNSRPRADVVSELVCESFSLFVCLS